VGFTLVANTRVEMDDMRDAVAAMYNYGQQKLTYQPTEPTDPERFCWALINNIRMAERKEGQTDFRQPVTVDFQVPYPRWEYGQYLPWTLGDGSKLGDTGLKIGGGGLEIAASGELTEETVTNLGNAEALVAIAFKPGTHDSCERPTIQRWINNSVVDQVSWTGLVGGDSELFICGKRRLITYNGAGLLYGSFDYEHPDFFRLAPGENTIKIKFLNAIDAATVTLWYAHTWV
jgi:hypothetical protein